MKFKNFPFIESNKTDDALNFYQQDFDSENSEWIPYKYFNKGHLVGMVYVSDTAVNEPIIEHHTRNFEWPFSIYKKINGSLFIVYNYTNAQLLNFSIKKFNDLGVEIYDTLIDQSGQLLEYNEVSYSESNRLDSVRTFFGANAWMIENNSYND